MAWLRPTFLRARGLVLTVTIVVAATLIWRGARVQRAAEVQAVAAWTADSVRAVARDLDAVPALGGTEPVVVRAISAWLREAAPPGIAADVRVDVVPLGGALLGGGGGDATHRATVEVRGTRAELDVRWTPGEGGAAGRGVVTAFRMPDAASLP
jgi:hypothetical protein